ncbi:MAG TPA: alpha/beta hydrolase [Vicinamibacterales bacterium]|nr:alpha/beta hydrolase [Vicinamibacterales bacterium]
MLRRTFLACLVLVAVCAPRATAQARQDRFFDSAGVKIRYVDVGAGDPVVLIHGFSSSVDANWDALGIIDKLAKDFRVVALDVRGHGKSDKPHDSASYGMAVVDDVVRLMDHLSVKKAHIVGYSMGGAITGKFVVEHPDRVISAVFGGSAPRMGWTEQNQKDADELATSLERGKGMRPLILRLAPPNEPKPSDDVVEQQSRAIIGRNDPLALAAVQRGNKDQTVTVMQVRAITAPMLAVVGSADPIKAGVDAFKRVAPSVQVLVIDGATHSGPRGAPGRPEFVAAVHDFLAAHRSTTSQ